MDIKSMTSLTRPSKTNSLEDHEPHNRIPIPTNLTAPEPPGFYESLMQEPPGPANVVQAAPWPVDARRWAREKDHSRYDGAWVARCILDERHRWVPEERRVIVESTSTDLDKDRYTWGLLYVLAEVLDFDQVEELLARDSLSSNARGGLLLAITQRAAMRCGDSSAAGNDPAHRAAADLIREVMTDLDTVYDMLHAALCVARPVDAVWHPLLLDE